MLSPDNPIKQSLGPSLVKPSPYHPTHPQKLQPHPSSPCPASQSDNNAEQPLLKSVKQLNDNLHTYNSRICEVLERMLKAEETAETVRRNGPQHPLEKKFSRHFEHSQDVLDRPNTPITPASRKSQPILHDSFGFGPRSTSPTAETQVKLEISGPLPMSTFSSKQLIVDISAIAFETANESPFFSLQKALVTVSKWVAEVYDTLTKQTFNAYYSRHLSQPQSKVFFTHNMALNFQHMSSYFWREHSELWISHRHKIITHFQFQTSRNLQFMMVKYPQKKKAYVSEEVMTAIPTMDRSGDPEFDVLANTGCGFRLDPTRKGYLRQLKAFINRLIVETKQHFRGFQRTMRALFRLDGVELDNKIGMKFKDDTPLFTNQEIEADGVEIKSPEVLRVIIKWSEELERRVKRLADGSALFATFPRKETGEPEYLTKEMRVKCGKAMGAEAMMRLKNAEDQLKTRIRLVLGYLPDYIDKYQPHFLHIKADSVRSGLLSYVLSQTAKNLSVHYLTFLIHFLQTLSKQVTAGTFSFVGFNVSDLLRCKCSGNLPQIKQIFERISTHPQLTVYRVKNRIQTSNRDFLVNAKLKDTALLVQIQLAITGSSSNPLEQSLNHFSHFLYELSRAKYGPIGQAVIINAHLTEFVKFFEGCLAGVREGGAVGREQEGGLEGVEVKGEGVIEVGGYHNRGNQWTFICSNCLGFRKAYGNYYVCYDSWGSVLAGEAAEAGLAAGGEQRMVCGECVVAGLGREDRARFLIGDVRREFFYPVDKLDQQVDYVCVVKKAASKRKVEVLQNQEMSGRKVYLPVFYQSSPNKKAIKIENLEDYHVFVLDNRLTKYEKTASQVLAIMSRNPNNKIFDRDLQQQIKFHLVASFFETPKPIDNTPKDLVSPVPYFTPSNLAKLSTFKVLLINNSHTPLVLLLNTLYNTDQLRRLNTHGRQLTKGQVTMISNSPLWNLQCKDLGDNSFKYLCDLTAVRQANLSCNKLTKVDFVISTSMSQLNLQGNNVRKLDMRESTYPNLQRLALSNNRIEEIVTVQHKALRILELRNCGIQELGEKMWRVPELEVLDVEGNAIGRVDMGAWQMGKLRVLNLGGNRMKQLNLPAAMPKLETLVLKQNLLHTVDMQTLELPKLKSLQLRQNLLEAIALPKQLPSLTDFILLCNKFKILDLSKLRAPILRSLQLAENQLQKLVLPELPKLVWFNAADNRLKYTDLRRQQHLRRIDLDTNLLETIELDASLPELEELVLGNNRFIEIDFESKSFPKLKTLVLQYNNLERVELGPNLPSLQSLSLSCNKLTSLSLPTLPSLTTLDLSLNHLQHLCLPPSPTVRTLCLTYNPTSLSETLPTTSDFPALINLTHGLPNLQLFTLWLLRDWPQAIRAKLCRAVREDPEDIEGLLRRGRMKANCRREGLIKILALLWRMGFVFEGFQKEVAKGVKEWMDRQVKSDN